MLNIMSMRPDLIFIFIESTGISWISSCVWYYEQEHIWVEIKKNLNDTDLERIKGLQGKETVTELLANDSSISLDASWIA